MTAFLKRFKQLYGGATATGTVSLEPETNCEPILPLAPICGQESVVRDTSGRVCYREICGWREKRIGRIDKPPTWTDPEPIIALTMPRPEASDVSDDKLCCPVCSVASGDCSHLCQQNRYV
jgi:hypothetical protein